MFKGEMKKELEKGTEQARVTIEAAMPGVNHQFDEVFKHFNVLGRKVDSNAIMSRRVMEYVNHFMTGMKVAAHVWGSGGPVMVPGVAAGPVILVPGVATGASHDAAVANPNHFTSPVYGAT